ncbi:MAG: hypothetical protein C4576_06675 [Desulfobacteraceae bacterium]|nr:MAG: hypothetical protein C4576_06675 [Desulfobacteraceae bacterium]
MDSRSDGKDSWQEQIAYCGWLFTIALLLRLGFVLFYDQYPALLADAAIYDSIGQSLAGGRGFVLQGTSEDRLVEMPQVRVGPIYPLFLACLYFIFGHSIQAVRITQAVLGAATVIFTVRIAWLSFGRSVARLAGVVAALYPALIVYAGMILTETTFAFLLVVCIWIASEAFRKQSAYLWTATGVFLGFAALLRTEALVIAPFLVGTLMRFGRNASRTRSILLLCLAMTLTVGTWTLRNYYHYNELILVSAHGGPTLWIATVGWKDWKFDDPVYQSLVSQGTNDIERARILQRQAIKNILDNPGRYLLLCSRRVVDLWLGSHTTYLVGLSANFQAYYDKGEFGRFGAKGTLLVINVGLIGLAFIGLSRSLRAGSELRALRWLCLSPIIAITAVHFFMYSGARYHVPVLPFVFIFSAAGMMCARVLLQSKQPLAEST